MYAGVQMCSCSFRLFRYFQTGEGGLDCARWSQHSIMTTFLIFCYPSFFNRFNLIVLAPMYFKEPWLSMTQSPVNQWFLSFPNGYFWWIPAKADREHCTRDKSSSRDISLLFTWFTNSHVMPGQCIAIDVTALCQLKWGKSHMVTKQWHHLASITLTIVSKLWLTH